MFARARGSFIPFCSARAQVFSLGVTCIVMWREWRRKRDRAAQQLATGTAALSVIQRSSSVAPFLASPYWLTPV
jgi:hypothetical protein